MPLSELANKRVRVLELLDLGPPSTPEPPSPSTLWFLASPLPSLLSGEPWEKVNFLMCGGLLGFPLLPGVCYGMWPGRWIPPPLLVEQSPRT